MANDIHLDGDFTLNIPHYEADFTENEQPKMQADFKIQTGGSTSFVNITGSPYDNEALTEVLNQKADNSTVEELSETVTNNYNTLDSKIDSTETALGNEISTLETDLNGKINEEQSARIETDNTLDSKIDTHIADKTNPHEVTKAQVGLGNVDNTSDLNKPISTATQTALNGKQNTISDLSEIRTNASNGQSAYNTIQTYGDIVTYDASSFATNTQGQKADTALQPNDNITELNNNAGFITGIDSTDVITALGYTPYNSSNPNGYTSNVGTVTSVNNTQPDANGNVSISTGGTVDQTFNKSSTNAQSGTAVLDMLKTIYPVGSLYFTVNNTCPIEALFGTWQSVATSIITSVSSTTSTSATVSVKGNGYTSVHTKSLTGRGSLSGGDEYFYSGANAVGHRTSDNNTNFGFSSTEGYAGLTGSVTIPSLTPTKTSLTCYIYKRTA